MAEYKGIKGFKVQSLDADPVPSVAGWSAGGNFPGSFGEMASTGTQTATLSAGYFSPGPIGTTASFTYDGTSWSPAPSMNTARHQVHNNMTGTQTASVIFCGRNPPSGTFGLQATEEFSGSSWTSTGNYPIELRDGNIFGIQTAAIAAGGNNTNPGVATNVNNSYNGSTWTATGNNNTTGRLSSCSFGTQTAGILIGGYINSPTPNTYFSNTEEYDGSTWTTGGAYPVGISSLSGGGSQTAGIAFAGGNDSGNPQATNTYDGATWTAASNMATGRNNAGMAKAGTSLSNIVFGGYTGTAYTNATEEYVDNSPYANKTVENIGQTWYNTTTKALKYTGVTDATWATGGNLNTGGYNSAGFGTQTDAVMAGRTPLSTAVEEYNGTAWTTVTSYPSPTVSGNRGFGVQTAGVSVGGEGGTPIVIRSDTQNYNGSTWTSGGSYPTAVEVQYSCGTATAGLCASGYPNVNQANEYNGSTWSTGGTPASSGRNNGATGGIQTAAYMAGGSPVASFGSVTEEYDGTSWSSGGTLVTPTSANSGFGTLTNGVTVGGENPVSGALNVTQIYNGTTWSTSTNLPRTATNYAVSGQNSPGSAGIIYGGPTPTNTQTDEFTGGGTASIKTVTVS